MKRTVKETNAAPLSGDQRQAVLDGLGPERALSILGTLAEGDDARAAQELTSLLRAGEKLRQYMDAPIAAAALNRARAVEILVRTRVAFGRAGALGASEQLTQG
jgi:hypothetical protein